MKHKTEICSKYRYLYMFHIPHNGQASLHPPHNKPRLLADRWEGAHSSAEYLIPPPGPHKLKVQSLVKLSHFSGSKLQLQGYRITSWYYPPEVSKPAKEKADRLN